jgi:hypothetical protein
MRNRRLNRKMTLRPAKVGGQEGLIVMKHNAILIITLIYLLSCTGITVGRLYCCGKLIAVSLNLGSLDQPEKKSEKTKDSCCNNIKQTFKIKDAHFNTDIISIHHSIPVLFSGFSVFRLLERAINLPITDTYLDSAPPCISLMPIYTLNCSYRI